MAATDFGIGCPHEALQDNSEVRSRRAPARLNVRKEWQRDGRVRRRRIQGSAVRTYGMTGGVAATDFGIGCPHEALQDNDEVRP